jgi:Cu/Ag efflux protein CusF
MEKRALVVLVAAVCLALATLFAQAPSKKKAHTLHGKIEQVNASTKSLTVNHEKVEGWMDAMTMTYAVDKESVLKELKPGDQIKATVYDDDLTLHDIQKEPAKK